MIGPLTALPVDMPLFLAGRAKDLDTPGAVEVELKSFDRRVRQLWQPGRPWPTYTNNGITVARLVRVIPAHPHGDSKPEERR